MDTFIPNTTLQHYGRAIRPSWEGVFSERHLASSSDQRAFRLFLSVNSDVEERGGMRGDATTFVYLMMVHARLHTIVARLRHD